MYTTTKNSIPQKGYTAKLSSSISDLAELSDVAMKGTRNMNTVPDSTVNILMVDDHPENLLALEAVLQSPNYNLISANSGEEALKWVLKQDFAVILLDVQMSGLNGFETAKLIKAREKSKHIPIIFITAINQTKEHVLHGYNVGAIDYIFKPFHPETLKLKVEEFVRVNEKLNRTTFDLRKIEELARVAGETLVDTIVTFDGEGYILSVNSAVKGMFGYSPEEIVGRHVSRLLPEMAHGADYLWQIVGRVHEDVALHSDGTLFPVDIQVGEANIQNECIFVCSIRDISERKQIEEERKQQYNLLEKLVEERTQELVVANEKLQNQIDERNKMAEDLRLSQEHFRKIFQSSPCLMAIQSVKDRRYIDVNASWINYTGYNYDEIKDQTSDGLFVVHSEQRKLVNRSSEGEGIVRNSKIRYVTKSGEIREGLLSSEIIEIQEEKCMLSVITDITERVHLEKEVARLDRLNLIGEMAAGIAHEIRNPMTTVRGFLQMARDHRENLSLQYINLMVEELDRANSIITEFLNLARNKTNDKTMQCLNSIIKALFPLIQAEALLSDKYVLLDLEECPELYLDEKEIRQLILNLALNGLEAMSSGGKLTIKTHTEDRAVVLEIHDQGNGIKPEFLEKIGTPFFTTKDMGTGLGLAMCYSVANRHNAVIDFKTSDQGTVFLIYFNI